MKKFASLLLTVVMLAAMLSVFALPASAEAQTIPDTDITWELTENDTVLPDGKTGRTLTIGGKDKMPDYIAAVPKMDKRPWKDDVKTITAVVIESGVTSIGDFAFFGCTSLQSVTIPSSVKSIGISAFENCTSLQSVTIPYGVENIGDNAFMNCARLQSVTIPSNVVSIKCGAFIRCNQLASVTVKASTPPTLVSNVFDNLLGNLAIYVPCGSVEDYKGATNWSSYRDQIKEAYVVDDQPGKNGTITFDKDTFPKETYTEPNETVTVTVMPAEGYQLQADSLLVTYKDENGEEMTADLTQDETDPMKYTFTMPCSNVTVKAEFEEIPNESETVSTPEGIEEGSTISNGNVWIIAIVAVVAVVGVATLVVVKKKKKPALASGENTDEE